MTQPPLSGKAKILVIEDEEPIQKFIARALESDYEVCVASDGQEGIKQAQWVQPQLVLLDLRMPGLDGITVLAKLKGNPKTQPIPVVIVSGRGDTDILLEGQRSGAADHIIKPFNVEDLRHVVQRQLLIREQRVEERNS
jgi:DNA-binding response OmpR family regulator